MAEDTPHNAPTFSAHSIRKWVDQVADQFEEAWFRVGSGQEPPRLEAYLSGTVEPRRSALFRELLRLELEYRRDRAESPTREEYCVRFLEHAELVGHVFDETELRESANTPGQSDGDTRGQDDRPGALPPADLATGPWVPNEGVAARQSDAANVSFTGRQLGDYELLEEIARGGMGVVYKARQRRLNRIVAVKMIRGGSWASDEEIARFRTEAEAAAKLQHPNIVAIHDVDAHDGQYYFSMEYVQGKGLDAMIKESPLPAKQAAAYVQTIAEAIHYAHGQGILHRDLKPSNVLIDLNGEPKVTDFGLAKRIEGGSELTRSGQVMGTPSYMPPEQADARRGAIGRTADVYSLGAILYELVTGRPPFRADTPIDTLRQVLETDPVSPRLLNPKLDRDVETICLKCLEKEPRRRYATALALADDLRRFLSGEPIQARPIGRTGRLWRWCRRNPSVAVLGAALTTVLLVTAVAATVAALRLRDQLIRQYVETGARTLDEPDFRNSFLWFTQSLKLAGGREVDRVRFGAVMRQLPRPVQVWFHTQKVNYAEFSPDGQMVVATCEDGTAQVCNAVTGQAVGRQLRHDAPVLHASFSPDGLHIATASHDKTARIWNVEDGQPVTPPLEHGESVRSAIFSPDGRHVLTASIDGTARLWEANTGKQIGELGHDEPVYRASFSPDGIRVVTAASSHVRVWDRTTGNQLVLTTPRTMYHASFSPDGRFVVAAGEYGVAEVWDPSTGEVTQVKGHSNDVHHASFSPDGNRVVTACWDRFAIVWDVNAGKQVARLEHEGPVVSALFSPDGRYVVTASHDGTARVWDASTGDPVMPPLEHGNSVVHASFSPDGHYVLTASHDGTARLWAPGEPVAMYLKHSDLVTCAAFRRDGFRIVTASLDRTARIWDAATGDPVGELLKHDEPVTYAAFSPDGTHALTVCADRTVHVWDVALGKEIIAPLRHPHTVRHAEFSPNGRRLLTACGDDVPDEGEAAVWDARTGERVGEPMKHRGFVNRASFNSAGDRVLTASIEGIASLWDAATGKPLGLTFNARHGVSNHGITYAEFSHDGRFVVTASIDQTAQVWDAATGRELAAPLTHKGQVFHASFSADSRRVVTASRDGTARVWHTATGEPVTPPLKHRGEVGHAEFSPDARRVVTASTDRTVRVWDASTGEPVTPALKHSDVVRQASFSPNGRFVITAGGDAAQVWDLTPHAGPVSDLTLLAQVVVGHSLSSAGDRPLDSKRFRDAYPRLRSSYPDDFARCRTLHN